MSKKRHLTDQEPTREELIQNLYSRYGSPQDAQKKSRFLWKKYAWLAAVSTTYFIKRAVDIIFSLAAMLFFLPFFLVIAFTLKISCKGPVLEAAKKVGNRGKEFSYITFHTKAAEEKGGGPRVPDPEKETPFGSILRKTGLKKLPLLWCVLKGEMSLFGPPPPAVSSTKTYSLDDWQKMNVKPGLVCYWQNGSDSGASQKDAAKLDMKYVQSQSLWLDLRLILQAIPQVFLGKAGY